jgi:hypothetical protein
MALSNNDIIKKLRVALKLRDDDIIEILKLVDYEIGKSELGAFFRKDDHPKYMGLNDQILRNFLNGLVIYKRGPMEDKRDHKRPKKQDYDNQDRSQKLDQPDKAKQDQGDKSGNDTPKIKVSFGKGGGTDGDNTKRYPSS